MATSKRSPSSPSIRYSPTITPLEVVERTAGGVAERFPGRDGRLLADHARAAHLLLAAVGVGDPPVALDQRHRPVAEIGDLDVVAPEIAAFVRIGTIRFESRLDRDFDLMCDRHVHGTGILAARVGASTGACLFF